MESPYFEYREEINELKKRIFELEKDKNRLNWLLEHQEVKIYQDDAYHSGGWVFSYMGSHVGIFNSAREAIDALILKDQQ